MMKTLLRSTALALTALCTVVAMATAAAPKPGASYAGRTGHHRGIRITVASHSTRRGVYKAVLAYCGFKFHITVTDGHFGIHTTTAGGAVSTFRAHGAWTSRQLVKGYIDLDFASNCQGLPGPFSAKLA